MSQELKSHSIGRNIERIRNLRGFKQDELAQHLGISRQSVSRIEQSDTVDEDKLEEIASFLGVSKEGIKNFSETGTINYIQNNFDGSNKETHYVAVHYESCTFNALEKYVEQVDEIKSLYEQLLKSERDKVEILQKLLEKK